MKRNIMVDTLNGWKVTYNPIEEAESKGGKLYQLNLGKKYSIQIATNKAGQFENNFIANMAEKDRGYTVPTLMKRSKNGMLTVWEWPEEQKPLNLNTEGMNLHRRVHNG